jgi:hypothetical protein
MSNQNTNNNTNASKFQKTNQGQNGKVKDKNGVEYDSATLSKIREKYNKAKGTNYTQQQFDQAVRDGKITPHVKPKQ